MGVLLFHLCKLKQAYPFCGATPLHPKKMVMLSYFFFQKMLCREVLGEGLNCEVLVQD